MENPIINAPNKYALVHTLRWNGFYLKLHMELTILAFLQTGLWEAAEDIASECLVEGWLKLNVFNVTPDSKSSLIKALKSACLLYLKTKQKRKKAEEQYFSYDSPGLSGYTSFQIERRWQVLNIARFFSPSEATVIRMLLAEEMDLLQISTVLQKPLSTVKLLQERAIYHLRKALTPSSLPMHQLR